MILVGLTGGLGSGKSTVAAMMAGKGAVVVDADRLARDAIDPGTPGYAKVVEQFGDEVLAPDGSIDREALAGEVFGDEGKRRALESIVHPEVFRLLAEEVARHRDTDDVVVFDAPLIVETGFEEACDVVIVVTAPTDVLVDRVVRDRRMDPASARARIAAQIRPEVREAAADIVIRNEGTLDELGDRVDEVWRELQDRTGTR